VLKVNILDRRRFTMAVAGVFAALPIAISLWPRAGFGQALEAGRLLGPTDIFVAESVPVDVTAGSVGEARERGLVQGRVAAFRKILERLVAREDLPRVPQQNTTQIIDMVREFSIANERSSAVRYLADLTVRFNPTAIRQLLRNAGVPFTETISRPLVVVPVMRAGGVATLWGGTNPWHDAWARTPTDSGLLPLIVPSGDAQDAGALGAQQALDANVPALAALAARYNAGGALVVVANMEASGPIAMTVIEVRADAAPVELSVTHSGALGQAAPEVIAGAVETAAAAAADNWRRRNRVSFGDRNQMTALVPVTDLQEWLAIRARLTNIALVDHVDVQAMTRDRVQITIHFAGEEEQLRLAMGQHNLNFTQQNGVWVIENVRKEAGREPTQPGTPSPPA
jgi:hypothetical protein